MREKIRDKERLIHILDAINQIQNRTPAISQDNLQSDILLYFGIVKCIEIYEAQNKLYI